MTVAVRYRFKQNRRHGFLGCGCRHGAGKEGQCQGCQQSWLCDLLFMVMLLFRGVLGLGTLGVSVTLYVTVPILSIICHTIPCVHRLLLDIAHSHLYP